MSVLSEIIELPNAQEMARSLTILNELVRRLEAAAEGLVRVGSDWAVTEAAACRRFGQATADGEITEAHRRAFRKIREALGIHKLPGNVYLVAEIERAVRAWLANGALCDGGPQSTESK